MSDGEDDEDAGKSWAEILAQRSPEGRACVLLLQQAEQACLEAQDRVDQALQVGGSFTDAFADFEAAFAEVGRMRKEVYRMARQ